MPLRPFAKPDGTLDTAAALQQAALLETLYHDRQQDARTILGLAGGGEVLTWSFRDSSWPPSLAVFKQGADYWAVIAGTQNAKQMVGNVAGAVVSDNTWGRPLTWRNRYWQFQADKLHDQAAPLLATAGADFTLHICGHSYGAGVAHLLALQYAEELGTDRVELLTFGEPKAITAGYSGPFAKYHFRVASVRDLVCYVPPGNALLIIPVRAPVKLLVGKALAEWEHYGRCYVVTDYGTIYEPTPTQARFGNLLQLPDADIAHHLTAHYVRQLAPPAKRETNGDPGIIKIADIGIAQGNAGFGQTLDESSQNGALVPDLTNSLYFPGVSPGPITPDNIAGGVSVTSQLVDVYYGFPANIGSSLKGKSNMAAPNTYKLTFALNNSVHGTSLSFAHVNPGGIAGALIKAQTLAQKLALLLGNNVGAGAAARKATEAPKIERVKISSAENPRVSGVFELDGPLYQGPFKSDGAAEALMKAISVRIPGINGVDHTTLHYAVHHIVGFPDGAESSEKIQWGWSMDGTKSFDDRYKELLGYLFDTTNQLGFVGKSTSEPKHQVSAFAAQANGLWQMTSEDPHTCQTGDKISLTDCKVPAFRGTWRVIRISDTVLQLDGDIDTTETAPKTAKIQRVQLRNGTRIVEFYQFTPGPGSLAQPYGAFVSKRNLRGEIQAHSFTHRRRTARR